MKSLTRTEVHGERHIYDYVITDSQDEKQFVEHLDKSTEVVVCAKTLLDIVTSE